MAQVPELVDVLWIVYPLVGGAFALMVFLPRLTTTVPAPLISIAALTALTVGAHLAVPTVGDRGALPSSPPVPVLRGRRVPVMAAVIPTGLGALALPIFPYAMTMISLGLKINGDPVERIHMMAPRR
ncbi:MULTISPECIES: hypothetical protein [Streptosporangium]|uniref:MFS superfamily sulfate permease-like transporter n=1 Tax=Streptosporangium brasiliense TaxID=47480 RepID=A0ABT9RFI0_9ACTN|nr:hypothetical protein [Streptosporangium brasiliense]MDP9868022.1 MFS superfamily sulfate permease-like transporter [Streptosporangium brasiliense]